MYHIFIYIILFIIHIYIWIDECISYIECILKICELTYLSTQLRVILVNMEISVILGHEKTKIRNIIDYGKIDVFSVRTNIHIKNKMMGHLIWPFGVLLYKTFQKWDVPRWRRAGWMIVVTCHTHSFCNTGTISAE